MAGKPLRRSSPLPDAADRLLGLIGRMVAEARPGLQADPALDSALERDLGLDSLARVELLGRVEREFEVELAEDCLVRVETPADLLREIRDAAGRKPAEGRQGAAPRATSPARGGFAARPDTAASLVEVLEWHAAVHPGREHILFYRSADERETLGYRQLLDDGRAVAAGLAAEGVHPGQAVAIMLPSGLDFFRAFYGALLAGAVPVPLYPPARLSQIEDHLRLQAGILANCQAPVLVTTDEIRLPARLLRAQVESLARVSTPAELRGAAPALPAGMAPRPDELALLQYTSGSTGRPKGVALTHANLLANIRAFSRRLAVSADDVCVSWLPLYHDMGLIGAWLGSLYNACPLVLMSPLSFLARPEQWLKAIHHHRGTVTAAPNFAYELCLHRIPEKALEGIDLSSLRLALNGAETVSPATLEAFCGRFAAHGFRREALKPVYGLAECSLALALPAVDEAPRIDRIARDPFATGREALPVADGDTGQAALSFVACGEVVPGHELRVVDDGGRELPERRVGRLQFRGPSAAAGYFRNPEATRALLDGEGPEAWRDTGDLGYLADGRLFPTGRVKDIIVRGGRNLHPEVLEEAIGRLPGVRKGCVAVFGAADPASGTERLVAVAETRSEDPAVHGELVRGINRLAVDLLGVPIDDVVLAPPHSVLKTSSGKIRRTATRDGYLAGTLGRRDAAAWRQLGRLVLAAARARTQRGWQRVGEEAYAIYAWTMFGLLAGPVWLAVALVPQPTWNWALCHRAARLLLRLVGVPLTVTGDPLPRGEACVVVANHASYLDGLLLVAATDRPLTFVAKRELGEQWVAGRFLRGLDAQFVDRFDARRGVDDARRLAALAAGGDCLAFFPEGTFTRAAGLRPFYMGAFAAAAQSRRPVVPVAIRGSRSLLREGGWFPRRAAITVSIGAPLAPVGTGWEAAMAMRDAARAEILRHCGEPDLQAAPDAAAIKRPAAQGEPLGG